MLCERCGKRPASVHVTKIVNNVKSEKYLCQQCAKEEGDLGFMMGQPFSVNSLLAGLLHQHAYGLPPNKEKEREAAERNARLGVAAGEKQRCPKCGTSYAEFAETGRLGCGSCYDEFERRLDPLIRRIHGSLNHVGKVPRRAGQRTAVEREIEKLRRELERCVAEERYERAAEIRDRIKELESRRG